MSYKYPSNVAEAAKLLDEVNPGWHNKIDLNILNLRESRKCILGQLYGTYDEGMKKVFNIDMCESGMRGTYLNDKIFGMYGSTLDWRPEITKRLKEAGLNFLEALALMKQGKKVCRKIWSKNTYIKLDGSTILLNNGINNVTKYGLVVDELEANDWTEYEYVDMSELNIGDLVILHSENLQSNLVDKVCTVVKDVNEKKFIMCEHVIYTVGSSLMKRVNANN